MSDTLPRNSVYVHVDDSGASYTSQTVLVPKGWYVLVPWPVADVTVQRVAKAMRRTRPLAVSGNFDVAARIALKAALEVGDE